MTTQVRPRGTIRLPRGSAVAWLPWAAVLLAPALGVLLLRAPLVNALANDDTWFYSGYGWALAHHVQIWGWALYYPDRFTVILPIAVSTGLLGPVAGYLVLRYILMAGAGALLYLCARRFTSPLIAVAGVCILALDAFYVRLMLWDYTTFIALPCTIAAVAIWYLGSSRRAMLWTALGTGVFLSAAIYANPLSAYAIPALFGIEFIAAIRTGRPSVITFVFRIGVVAVGAVLVFVVGYLGYRAYIGPFPVKDMYQATLDFIHSNNQLSAPFVRPVSTWIKGEPWIYGPVLVCLGVVVVLGRSLLQNTLRARVAGFAVAYTAIFWVFRFAFTSADVETWWAYGMAAVTTAFAMPAILDELVLRAASRWRWTLAAALAATGVADLVVRVDQGTAMSVFHSLRTHVAFLLIVLIAAYAAVWMMAVAPKAVGQIVALATFCAIVAAITLTPANNLGDEETGNFSPLGPYELAGYQAAYNMVQLIASNDRPASRTLLWDDLYGFADISWANLPHQGGGIENVAAPTPVPQLTAPELSLLRFPTTSRVLVLSDSPQEVAGALPALRKEGLDPRLEKAGSWVDGKLQYELIKLHAAGDQGGDAAAVRAVAQAYVSANTQRDPAAICRLVIPPLASSFAAEAGGSCERHIASTFTPDEPVVKLGRVQVTDGTATVSVAGDPTRSVGLMKYLSQWMVTASWELR